MIDVFLSASIPLPSRDPRYYESADIICIREAIKSLADVVLPVGRITFGGHPTITPLLAFTVREAGLDRTRLTLFQSAYFDHEFPKENVNFLDLRVVARDADRDSSLRLMRDAMITSRRFDAGVFIGGMEGVEAEANLFRELHPDARMMPIASSGAAAALVFRAGEDSDELLTELTYHTLFRRALLGVTRRR